jgi:hypothetical protein
MRRLTRWMLAILAVAGLNGVTVYAQDHSSLTASQQANALDLGSIDLTADANSDGFPYP